MDPGTKKNVLRMIPYGLYVLASRSSENSIAASTVNWVTQASFYPPLIAVGVKADSNAIQVIEKAKYFALNFLGKKQADIAYKFFKSHSPDGDSVAGEEFAISENGIPLFKFAIAYVECSLVDMLHKGDHSLVIGKIIDAQLNVELSGRPDEETLVLRDLGEKVFYGG